MKWMWMALACAGLLRGQGPVELAEGRAPQGGQRFEFDAGGEKRAQWSVGGLKRVYFDEDLPALFSRTVALDEELPAGSALEWIFTGPEGGVTVRVESGRVKLTQRYYDSYGHFEEKAQKARYPNRTWLETEVEYRGRLRTVEVTMDHKLAAVVKLNGQEAARQRCLMEMRRHQAAWIPAAGVVQGKFGARMLAPAAQAARVTVRPGERHQRIYGFGGILSVPAYAKLSAEGKRRWFELLAEYNLLLQREYPNGYRLKRDLSNFDGLADASPHYYGDNFPNGEISDFDFSRRLRAMGGKVLFQFWAFPDWMRREYRGADGKVYPQAPDVDAYVRAVVGYCRTAQAKAGAPPEVVGVQNEVEQPAEVWHEMVLKLRAGLDAAGFREVKIHMPDHSNLKGGTRNALALRRREEVWKKIDWAATHVYDFQEYFEDPDGYDAVIRQWREAVGEKPFLSTEFTVNKNLYQANGYRIAFAMAQLYHKNMALMDAAALIYCWSLLDVEQASFGGTRSLFVADRSRSGMPVSSSHQARVFGAYSRRLREGMARVGAETAGEGLLATAYEGEGGRRTVVLINRGTAPLAVKVEWAGAGFRWVERVSPYDENTVRAAGAGTVELGPGEMATVTNVGLGGAPRAVPHRDETGAGRRIR